MEKKCDIRNYVIRLVLDFSLMPKTIKRAIFIVQLKKLIIFD